VLTEPSKVSGAEEAMFATYSFSNAGTTYNIEFYYRELYSRIRARVLVGDRELRGLFNRFYSVDAKRRKMLSVYRKDAVPEVRLNFGRFSLTESELSVDTIYDTLEEFVGQSFPKLRYPRIVVSPPPGMLKKTCWASLGRFYLVGEQGHVDPFTLENLRVAYNRENIKAKNRGDFERIGRSLIEAEDAPSTNKMAMISDVNEIPKYSRSALDSENEKKIMPPRSFSENGTDYWVCYTYRQLGGSVFQYKFGFQKGELTSVEELVLGRNKGAAMRILGSGAPVKRQTVTRGSRYVPRARNRAAEGSEIERIRTLVAAGVDVNVKQRFGYTPLHYAVWDGNRNMVGLLIDKGAAINAATWLGDTPLHSASERHRNDIAEFLISKGTNVNAKGNYGRTPLHHAARLGNKDMVTLLLTNSADVNSREEGDYTPLHGAAQQGYTDVAKVLVLGGANVDMGNRGGYPPIWWAAQRDHRDMVQFLIASGADVNAKYRKGETLLHEAAQFGGRNAAEALLDNGADINAADDRGNTPVRNAIFWHHEKLAEFLIFKGADITGEDKNGETLLRVAADTGSHGLVELLISKGADVNTKNRHGETPLHEAAKYGKKEMVRLLLAHGADVYSKTKAGQTPLGMAEANSHADIVELLTAAGAQTPVENKSRNNQEK
jgi:cytohesin